MHDAPKGYPPPDRYVRLDAPARLAYLSASLNPAEELKRILGQLGPGFGLNEERIEKCPKVLLIGAYEPLDLPAGRFNAPPFGLQRLASFLRAAGVDAHVFDVTSRGEGALARLIAETHYDLVGFSILGPTLPHDIQLGYRVKALSPESILVAGGLLATTSPDLLVVTPLDYLIAGYGEDPLLNLVVGLFVNQDSELDIPGLWQRDTLGRFSVGQPAREPSYSDLRAYSFALDPTIGLDVRYASTDGLHAHLPSERLNVSRFIGQCFCPMRCSFCSTRNFLRYATGKSKLRYVALSPDDWRKIVASMEARLPSLETVFINDDDFFAERSTARSFFAGVIDAKRRGTLKDIKFIVSARVDEIDVDTLCLAREAGVILINVGVESFSPEGLRSLRKGIRSRGKEVGGFIDDSLRSVLECGIIPSANLIVFYPDVNWGQMYRSIVGATRLLEQGGEVNLTTYVRVYHGADILEDPDIPRSSYAEPILDYRHPDQSYVLVHDTVLLPRSREMRAFAEHVIVRRSLIEEKTKREFGWSHRRAPSKVVQLIFLRALLEESFERGYHSHGQTGGMAGLLSSLIEEEFRKLKHGRVTGAASDSPLSSLATEHQQEARVLAETLRQLDVDLDTGRLLFDLKTAMFCMIWDCPELSAIRPYLVYLFFAEEKSRFFHLDDLDKYIVAHTVVNSLTSLTEGQHRGILSVLGVPPTDCILPKLRLLAEHQVWHGPDEQVEYSRRIRILLHRLEALRHD